MPRVPKRTKAPPRRVWVILSDKMIPLMVLSSENEAVRDLNDGEVVYRYDIHER